MNAITRRLSTYFDTITDRLYGPHKCTCGCGGEWFDVCGTCGKCGAAVSCVHADIGDAAVGLIDAAADALADRRQQHPASGRWRKGALRVAEAFLRRMNRSPQ